MKYSGEQSITRFPINVSNEIIVLKLLKHVPRIVSIISKKKSRFVFKLLLYVTRYTSSAIIPVINVSSCSQRLSSVELPDVITPDTPNMPAPLPKLKIHLKWRHLVMKTFSGYM